MFSGYLEFNSPSPLKTPGAEPAGAEAEARLNVPPNHVTLNHREQRASKAVRAFPCGDF